MKIKIPNRLKEYFKVPTQDIADCSQETDKMGKMHLEVAWKRR